MNFLRDMPPGLSALATIGSILAILLLLVSLLRRRPYVVGALAIAVAFAAVVTGQFGTFADFGAGQWSGEGVSERLRRLQFAGSTAPFDDSLRNAPSLADVYECFA